MKTKLGLLVAQIVMLVARQFWHVVFRTVARIDKSFRNEVLEGFLMCIRFSKRRKYTIIHLRNLIDEHILTEVDLDPDKIIWRDLKSRIWDSLKQDQRRGAGGWVHSQTKHYYQRAIIRHYADSPIPLHYMRDIGFLVKSEGWKEIGKEIRITHTIVAMLRHVGEVGESVHFTKSEGFNKMAGKIASMPSDEHPHGRGRPKTDPGVDHTEDRPDRQDDLVEARIRALTQGIDLPRITRIELWNTQMFPMDTVSIVVERGSQSHDKNMVHFQKTMSWSNDPLPETDRIFTPLARANNYVRLWKGWVTSPRDMLLDSFEKLISVTVGELERGPQHLGFQPINRYLSVSVPIPFQEPGIRKIGVETTRVGFPVYDTRLGIRLFTWDRVTYRQLFWVTPIRMWGWCLAPAGFENKVNSRGWLDTPAYVAFQVEGGLHNQLFKMLGLTRRFKTTYKYYESGQEKYVDTTRIDYRVSTGWSGKMVCPHLAKATEALNSAQEIVDTW